MQVVLNERSIKLPQPAAGKKEPWLKWSVQTKQYAILNGVKFLRRQGQIRGTIYFNIGEQSGNGYQQSCLVLHALGDTHFVENWPVNFHEKLREEAKLWLLPI